MTSEAVATCAGQATRLVRGGVERRVGTEVWVGTGEVPGVAATDREVFDDAVVDGVHAAIVRTSANISQRTATV